MKTRRIIATVVVACLAGTVLYALKPAYSVWSKPNDCIQGRFYCSHTWIDPFSGFVMGAQIRNTGSSPATFTYCNDNWVMSHRTKGKLVDYQGGDGSITDMRRICIAPHQVIDIAKRAGRPPALGSQEFTGSIDLGFVGKPIGLRIKLAPLRVYVLPWFVPVIVSVMALLIKMPKLCGYLGSEQ